jgi:predicted nucleic acid-binding protein
VAVAYIDSSCVVAIAFGEPGARKAAAAARAYSRLVSSNLLEAEVRSALARERTIAGSELFSGISWVHPNRVLTQEIEQAIAHGGLRGADLWHVACALFLDPTASELAFVTLDVPQRRVAAALGFETP